jgi:RNA polymerase sigma factor (sigma-70 family)
MKRPRWLIRQAGSETIHQFNPLESLLMSGEESALRTRPSLLLRIRDCADADSWRTFVTIYAPIVHRYACRQGLQDADAADLSQEVMGKVARAIRTFEYSPERGRFRDWLLTITRQRVALFHESRARLPEQLLSSVELGQGTERPDADWTADFNGQVLEVALDRARPHFEPMTWRAFERVWLENRSAAETARELAQQIEFVYYAKSRVLKRLKEEVHEIVEDFSCLDNLRAS